MAPKVFNENDHFNSHIEKCEFVAVLICRCFFTCCKMLKRNYPTAIRSNWKQQIYWNKARYIHGFCTFTGFFSSYLCIRPNHKSFIYIARWLFYPRMLPFRVATVKDSRQKRIELVLSHQRKWLTRVCLETNWSRRVVEISVLKHLIKSSVQIFGLFSMMARTVSSTML